MSTPPKLRLRVLLGSSVAIGPGKADLLTGIAETGSISAAGRRMDMSYKRAWHLIDTMNRYFRSPLVDAAKGGRHGGGACLTPLGIEVLARYRAMEKRAARVNARNLARLQALLAKKTLSRRR